MIKAEDIADTVRRKVGIVVDETNKGKITFTKQELLMIIAYLSRTEEDVKEYERISSDLKAVVSLTVAETLKSLKEES